jgi:hypothetical protein
MSKFYIYFLPLRRVSQPNSPANDDFCAIPLPFARFFVILSA